MVLPPGGDESVDFVDEQPGSISGTITIDTTGNKEGDEPHPSVTVVLRDKDGAEVAATTTDSNGHYTFPGVKPGDYTVTQTVPEGFKAVNDVDGGDLTVIGDVTKISVDPGQDVTGQDFVNQPTGASISGFVLEDVKGDGTQYDPIAGVTVTLKDKDSGETVATTVTAADGSYAFTDLEPGTYIVEESQPDGFHSISDVDGGDLDIIGDVSPIDLKPGEAVTNQNFIEGRYGTISGTVTEDTDGDGAGDKPIPGVTVELKDSEGNTVATTTTDGNGYYEFPDLEPGGYTVVETDPDGYDSVTPNEVPVVLPPGGSEKADFVDERPGALSGTVWVDTDADGVGDTPLPGAVLALVDADGNPALDENGDPVTTVSDEDGRYSFTGLPAGDYGVRQVPTPSGHINLSDVDGGDPAHITKITVVPGETNTGNDFVLVSDCPTTWAHWKQLHPGADAAGNLDSDAYDNFAEYAFAMPDNGGGSPHLGHTAWILQPSAEVPGTIEAVFVRPIGWEADTVYTLEYASTIGSPTVWTGVVLDESMITVVPNGDCTETVTVRDLEGLTGLEDGTGVVRIVPGLDDPSDPDHGHTSPGEPGGWTETGLAGCCQTYSTPYQRETVFTGVVAAVEGQELFFEGLDLQTELVPGVSWYAEVLSGANEGQRFDVLSITGDTVILAVDSDIHDGLAPHNTLAGPAPASLVGDLIAIRPHRTLDDLFPVSGFGAADTASAADMVQVYANGGWTSYWLYDGADTGPASPRWAEVGDGSNADRGSVVIPPGQGVFVTKRSGAAPLLTMGEIRTNDFVRPLQSGARSNLVGGGYPVDQSPLDRGLTVGDGFFGSRDFKTADTILVWRFDGDPDGVTGYDTYYLLGAGSPAIERWVKVGDASLTSYTTEELMAYDRAVMLRSANDQSGYTTAAPWTP